ncbi:uncharacterized protein LOC135165471 [Diachasmimorpha longicaudata]|uniref:uncharacterized protein LOC135165471 n=1 Tax=Diachasmimorpha longicaudata TaxID=58733 RepID=UPI0030B90464
MFIHYFYVLSIVSTTHVQIQGVKLNDTLEYTSNRIKNILPAFNSISKARKYDIYNDINGDINWRLRAVVSDNRQIKRLKAPSTFLKPPSVQKLNMYNYYKNIMDQKLLTNHETYTTPKTRKGEEKYKASTSFYIRDHAPTHGSQSTEKTIQDEQLEGTEHSNEVERINFHIHGHEGPETYVFGYDTGNGNNRQFRYEERHDNGTVTGHYGYYDARGKLHKVHYTSHPSIGYNSFSLENTLKLNNH